MPDLVDIANPIVELCTAEAEHRARGKSGPEIHPGFDHVHCVDCGEDIPLARLKLGKVRCFDCQSTLEWEIKVGRR